MSQLSVTNLIVLCNLCNSQCTFLIYDGYHNFFVQNNGEVNFIVRLFKPNAKKAESCLWHRNERSPIINSVRSLSSFSAPVEILIFRHYSHSEKRIICAYTIVENVAVKFLLTGADLFRWRTLSERWYKGISMFQLYLTDSVSF